MIMSLKFRKKRMQKSMPLGHSYSQPLPMPITSEGMPDWEAPDVGAYVSYAIDKGPLKGRVVVLHRMENGLYSIAEDDSHAKHVANRDLDTSKLEKDEDADVEDMENDVDANIDYDDQDRADFEEEIADLPNEQIFLGTTGALSKSSNLLRQAVEEVKSVASGSVRITPRLFSVLSQNYSSALLSKAMKIARLELGTQSALRRRSR